MGETERRRVKKAYIRPAIEKRRRLAEVTQSAGPILTGEPLPPA